jgi:hypothetical protein
MVIICLRVLAMPNLNVIHSRPEYVEPSSLKRSDPTEPARMERKPTGMMHAIPGADR